ncbi:MAG: hypothetical protein ISQ20_05145 [Alphaproteobacteria bacterium]|nr:hypothetical protein [Alphaproteobacteria bacterium]
MTDEHQDLLQAWDVLGETTDILLDSLLSKDMDKSHEAVSVLLMQAMNTFGQEHPVFQQCFPVWDAIKSHIDANNLERALSQARTWKKQLDEIKAIIS